MGLAAAWWLADGAAEGAKLVDGTGVTPRAVSAGQSDGTVGWGPRLDGLAAFGFVLSSAVSCSALLVQEFRSVYASLH